MHLYLLHSLPPEFLATYAIWPKVRLEYRVQVRRRYDNSVRVGPSIRLRNKLQVLYDYISIAQKLFNLFAFNVTMRTKHKEFASS